MRTTHSSSSKKMSSNLEKSQGNIKEVYKLFSCTKQGCKRSFTSKRRVQEHIYKMHSKSIKCPECNAEMKKSSLSLHLRSVHTKEKNKCKNCGKKISIGYLNRHLKFCNHDGSRKFKCLEKGCEKLFKTDIERMQHSRTVHSKPVQCPYRNCTVKIKKCNLRRHIRTVHKKLRTKCGDCEKKILYTNFKQHVKMYGCNGSQLSDSSAESCDESLKTSAKRPKRTCQNRTEHSELNRSIEKKKRSPATHFEMVQGLIKMVQKNLKGECDNCGIKMSLSSLERHVTLCIKLGSHPLTYKEDDSDGKFETDTEESSSLHGRDRNGGIIEASCISMQSSSKNSFPARVITASLNSKRTQKNEFDEINDESMPQSLECSFNDELAIGSLNSSQTEEMYDSNSFMLNSSAESFSGTIFGGLEAKTKENDEIVDGAVASIVNHSPELILENSNSEKNKENDESMESFASCISKSSKDSSSNTAILCSSKLQVDMSNVQVLESSESDPVLELLDIQADLDDIDLNLDDSIDSNSFHECNGSYNFQLNDEGEYNTQILYFSKYQNGEPIIFCGNE